MRERLQVRQVVILVAALVACLVVGTLWHEVVGHGLTAIVCGGTITEITILGVRLWPSLAWIGADGVFGRCNWSGVESENRAQLIALAGSMSTWLVSVAALIALHRHGQAGAARWLLALASIWWIDLLTYTIPSFGLRRFVVIGRYVREPYDAAVALGIPGSAFQAFVVIACLAQLMLLIRLFRRTCSSP